MEMDLFSKWSPGDIKCLIALYEAHQYDFDNSQKSKVWQNIAQELSTIRQKNIGADKCIGKWKGLKAQYKKIKDHNGTSGNSPKYWEHFEDIDKILFKRPEINAPAVCSSDDSSVVLNELTNTQEAYEFADIIIDEGNHGAACRRARKRKAAEVDDVKARRHKDKMERTDKFLDLMSKLVNHVTATAPPHAEGTNVR